MYFVGIDISKFKHDCAIIDELGDVITPSWSFQNDREGFSLLSPLHEHLSQPHAQRGLRPGRDGLHGLLDI